MGGSEEEMELPRGDGGVPMRGGGVAGKGGGRCGVREKRVRLRGASGRECVKREMERGEGDRMKKRWRAVAGQHERKVCDGKAREGCWKRNNGETKREKVNHKHKKHYTLYLMHQSTFNSGKTPTHTFSR